MTVPTTYLREPTAGRNDLQARFEPIFQRVAEGNVERERSRIFPHEQVRWLNDAGLGTVRIPEEFGGLGASLEQTFALLADLGEADANVSHIWRNHLAFV
jgi:alkylation response protein AidB-like acyl-CoA dehydrogenase